MRISALGEGLPVHCHPSFPTSTFRSAGLFPHTLPTISIIRPDLFTSCCQAHTSLPHRKLNSIPTAPLSLRILSFKRPWAGLVSRGALLERKKGIGEWVFGMSFWQRSFTRSHSTPGRHPQHKTAGMTRGGQQAGLPTATDRPLDTSGSACPVSSKCCQRVSLSTDDGLLRVADK